MDLKKFREKYIKLPERIKDVYSSFNTTKILQDIGTQHGLHVDQIGELVDETGLVMLGVTHPRDYVGNIVKKLKIDKEKASAVARDVNENVFKPIREELKKLHGVQETEEVQSSKFLPRRQAGKVQNFEEEKLDREQILKEIENDESGLGGDLPKRQEKIEKKLHITYLEPKKPNVTYLEPKNVTMLDAQTPSKKYKGQDPYREPID